jgi:uncharacterized protein (DUF169 family)
MDLKKINDTLNQYIRPQTYPVALKLCKSEDELPEKVRMPVRDMGYPIALCQATALSRRFGWTMALGKEDHCCIGGARTMGLETGGTGGPAAEDKQLEPGKYSYHLTAALERADFEPDVIVIVGNSAQVMRLAQSAIGGPGGQGVVNAVATGFGDCGDVAARTMLTDTCQFILPSGGDRIFGSTQDHELIFAIPGSKIEAVVDGLANTHKIGFRYPVITDIRHRPNLPPLMEMPKS